MILSIPFLARREQAIRDIRARLATEGLVEEAGVNGGYGHRFTCFKEKAFYVTVYFRKSGLSSSIVCDCVPAPLLAGLREMAGAAVPAGTGSSPGPAAGGTAGPAPFRLKGRWGAAPRMAARPIEAPEVRIGTDESGKGDYFGPLVVAGVWVDGDLARTLSGMGIRDSKELSDKDNLTLAKGIKELLGRDRYDIVKINPEKYNELYQKMSNINKILAWAHATAIENLLGRNECGYAIIDQFANERYVTSALKERGRAIEIFQTPKAERDTAVGAASILAREAFVSELAALGRDLGLGLLKGASPKVDALARKIMDRFGPAGILRVAKIHFRNTQKAGLDLGGPHQA
ncbi:MAG: ribonuclease HIII [Deltaproteobacteria bacterium]|jgi:ribonuclease HIII|nr:ribonuclease HIII [Deltaproteobacteria bacterium]